MRKTLVALISYVAIAMAACSPAAEYDIIIRRGTLYDGSGGDPIIGDVAIQGDTLTAVGTLENARAKLEIDAEGLAVTPGFINMLSWATESLIESHFITGGHPTNDISPGHSSQNQETWHD